MDAETIRNNSKKYQHQGFGVLRYRDERLVIEIEGDIIAYYLWLKNDSNIIKPSRKAHISILKGVDAEKYDGERVEFTYSHTIRFSGDTTGRDKTSRFRFLDVWCARAEEIREELNLETYLRFHITIGVEKVRSKWQEYDIEAVYDNIKRLAEKETENTPKRNLGVIGICGPVRQSMVEMLHKWHESKVGKNGKI